MYAVIESAREPPDAVRHPLPVLHRRDVQLPQVVEVALAARADHAGTPVLRDLRLDAADAARRGGDDHRVGGADPKVIEGLQRRGSGEEEAPGDLPFDAPVLGHELVGGTMMWLAWAPVLVCPTTLAPTRSLVTPGPQRRTIPAKSLPDSRGHGSSCQVSSLPLRRKASMWLIAVEITSTSTSPGPGAGSGY